MESTASYWCHRCTRFVRVWSEESLVCPHCDSGFIEAVTAAPPPSDSPRPFPAAAMYMIGPTRPDPDRASNLRSRRQRRNHGDRSPFNPVIVLRGPADESRDDDGGEGGGERRSFELYYNDGAGSGLRPLPAAMSEFLMGSGFDRLLDQLSQIEINGLGRHEQPPASKSAVESMPTVEIVAGHVTSDSHCAVCKEAFVIGSEAREMPCKHIYHSDCILPWLSLRNSCPVCRHELPAESASSLDLENGDEETVGLTIWRLPGGGFAVGRFTGGRRAGEREIPAVFTEMDGGFNSNSGGGGGARRIAWGPRRGRGREGNGGGGVGRVFRNLFSFIGRLGNSNSGSGRSGGDSQSVSSIRRSRSHSSGSVFNRYFRRRNRAWVLGEENGMARW